MLVIFQVILSNLVNLSTLRGVFVVWILFVLGWLCVKLILFKDLRYELDQINEKDSKYEWYRILKPAKYFLSYEYRVWQIVIVINQIIERIPVETCPNGKECVDYEKV